MKKRNKILLPLLALAAAAALLFAAWYFTRPAPVEGAKALTIQVVHGDGSEKTFPIRTDAEFLADALIEHGLASGEESAYGLFITTVDGETADAAKQEWWRVSSGGEMLMVGAGDEVLYDGVEYELVLVTGYE